MKLGTYDVITQEEAQAIHAHSLEILSEIGIDIKYEPARKVFIEHGQRVEGERVYLDPAFVEAQVKKAPAKFTLHARNPEHNVVIGDGPVFMPGYGAPFIYEADGSKRESTMADYDNFVKLAGASKNLHMTGGNVVEPNDIPDKFKHLHMTLSHIKNSDKCYMGSASGYDRAKDTIDMTAMLFGGGDVIREKPALICLINSLTPLIYDERMLGALMAYSEAGQAMVIASLVMAGTTGPATLAGTMALQNAEVLAGIALVQSINPGNPVVYGSTSSITEMRSGTLIIGTAECALLTAASAAMARFYGVPCRGGGGLTDSKTVDAQAGAETMMTLLSAAQSGVNFILHSAGILQYYMAMSYEKFCLDDDVAGSVLRYIRGIEFDEDTFAVDVVKDVGPGSHFMVEEHTIMNFKDEFYTPNYADRANYDTWAKEKMTLSQRANAGWKDILDAYNPPALDADIAARLQSFIEQRTKELS